jgi:hypothetical protein
LALFGIAWLALSLAALLWLRARQPRPTPEAAAVAAESF